MFYHVLDIILYIFWNLFAYLLYVCTHTRATYIHECKTLAVGDFLAQPIPVIYLE
jgi:hypothetical protein